MGRQMKEKVVELGREQNGCPDILGKGGGRRSLVNGHVPEGLTIMCASRLLPLIDIGTL
jgi:hypothetical protein